MYLLVFPEVTPLLKALQVLHCTRVVETVPLVWLMKSRGELIENWLSECRTLGSGRIGFFQTGPEQITRKK